MNMLRRKLSNYRHNNNNGNNTTMIDEEEGRTTTSVSSNNNNNNNSRYTTTTTTTTMNGNNSNNNSPQSVLQLQSSTTTTTIPLNNNNNNKKQQQQKQKKRKLLLRRIIYVILFIIMVIIPITRTLGIRIIPKTIRTKDDIIPKPYIPYPPIEKQISVVIMNHARPYVIQHSLLLPTLINHPNINDILILHSNPITAFNNEQLQHIVIKNDNNNNSNNNSLNKIKHINATQANDSMGLGMRFHYCSTLCINEWVLHIDDDMECDDSAINELIIAMIYNSKRLIGHYGRKYNYWKAINRYGYDTKDYFGTNLEVILTKILLLEKVICTEFWKYAYMIDDMIPYSQPKWNGEDIFVNLIANHYYNVPYNGPYNNYAIPNLNVWEASEDLFGDEVSVSGNMDRNRIWNVGFFVWWNAYWKAQSHTKYRGKLWYITKQRLNEY